ncbi:unnamed protein product [Enterobius vermicularis]|uniref:ANK_REP_REGION domain-containing protein n=1 Tax=Enterobius vermicularis TaxID=51028 RepID=A0A3P6J5X9_ENTVE|nr:unnamed protein product [Enterobius vermicularis]
MYFIHNITVDYCKVDPTIEQRILSIDLDGDDFRELEEIVIEGKTNQIWLMAKKYSDDERLCTFIKNFRNLQDGRTAVHIAAVQQNAIYDTLMEYGADVNLPDEVDIEGVTAAQYRKNAEEYIRPSSAMSSPSSLVNVLKCQQISISEAPKEAEVEQWLAAGNVQKLEQLLLDGRFHMLLDKTSVNPQANEFLKGASQYQAKIDAIHKAVDDGDMRRVKSLIDREQLSVARDRYGMTPLHKAILHEQTNVVRYLLAKYPSCVNATDHNGRTALHYAASADPSSEIIIKMLQKAGGDAFIEDKRGHTPFYYRNHDRRLNIKTFKEHALMNQLLSGELSRFLLQDLEEDIHDWIHSGNIGKLEELVLTGYGDLLLGQAHEADDQDVITFLEVLPQYQAKIRAIHKAVESNNLKALKLLVDRKKMALCRDEKGLTPLHKAVIFKRNDCAKFLIHNYPQTVNALDQKKRTPLHYAAALRDGGHLYQTLRKAGADANSYDCVCSC